MYFPSGFSRQEQVPVGPVPTDEGGGGGATTARTRPGPRGVQGSRKAEEGRQNQERGPRHGVFRRILDRTKGEEECDFYQVFHVKLDVLDQTSYH
jgi:hypothetical protein